MLEGKRVAIVHDWLIAGGAEKVVLELHRMFPDAPIYTSYCTLEWRQKLDNKVVTGFLQHLGKFRKFIPLLRIYWFGRLKLDGYDIVISSSGAEAKGIKTLKDTLHIAYIHAPTHYYWSRYDEYLQKPGFGSFDWLARIGLKLLVTPLRRWDYRAAQKPEVLIANSKHTQLAIKKYYGRGSELVHPPVDTNRFAGSSSAPRTHFVIAGRLTPYKRFDLAIQACSELNLPLTVVGDGPDMQRLQNLAGPTITFTGYVSDIELAKQISSAQAFIFPGLDDFGIAPVEAMAAGTPVIAYQAGGALDYVIPGKTGQFFAEQSVESLKACLEQFKPNEYSSHDIKQVANNFSIEKFHDAIQLILKKVV